MSSPQGSERALVTYHYIRLCKNPISCFGLCDLEITQYEIGDAFKQLNSGRSIADPMAAAGKDHQTVRVTPSVDEFVDHFRGIREMNVVISRAMREHQLAF